MTAPRNDYELAVWRRAHGEPGLALPPKPRKKRGNEESRIQQSVCRWWALACRNYQLPEFLLFKIANEGWRSPVTAAIMKREGLRAGCPDMMLAVMRGLYAGLFVELKKPGGIVSPAQTEFIRVLGIARYCARVCYSYDEAVGLIVRYLAGEENL